MTDTRRDKEAPVIALGAKNIDDSTATSQERQDESHRATKGCADACSSR